ncbi:hypothetical protein F4677DRAFT_465025 [Hypoxylon crocopeplum]|nr:hypothetical protein F4677DRAFT_465025 [Hypoxylon crocopeplum]
MLLSNRIQPDSPENASSITSTFITMTTHRNPGHDTAQPTMASVPFNQFPAELRLRVWNEALLQESSERIVFLGPITYRIIPFKSLVSPMLSVNVESRACATEFYNVKLRVYRLLELSGHYKKHHKIPDPQYFTEAAMHSNTGEGCLYLSPQHDLFTAHFNMEARLMSSIRPSMRRHPISTDDWAHLRHATSYARNLSSRVENAVAIYTHNGQVHRWDSGAKMELEQLQHSNKTVDILWDDYMFPFVQRRFYYRRVSTELNIDDLLLQLYRRNPGQPLPNTYQIREIIRGDRDNTWTDK